MNVEAFSRRHENTLSPAAKIALGLFAAGSLFVLYEIGEDQEQHEQEIETCVSDLVGRDVNLVTHPETGVLSRPASVFHEVTACQQSGGDAAEAKILLDD